MDAADSSRPQLYHQKSQSQPQAQSQKHVKTGTWLPAEDARLRAAVAQHGTRWVAVAGDVGTRNGDQCAKRWSENLNPELDHSPWTPEEEERLLNLVDIYGHNWKFMADSFLEARAPLALKNRYSLLMRRLKRQGNRQQKQSSNTDDSSSSRHNANSSRAPSGSSSPLATTNPVDQTGFFNSTGVPQSHQTDFATMTASSSNFSLPGSQFAGSMVFPDTSTTGHQGVDGTVQQTGPAPWDDQDLVWQQQHPFLTGDIDLDNVSASTGPTTVGEMEVDKMTMVSDHSNSSDVQRSRGGSSSDSGASASSAVEYSVTCQRAKLKTLVNHLMDAAMSETAGRPVLEDDMVTVTLRLKV